MVLVDAERKLARPPLLPQSPSAALSLLTWSHAQHSPHCPVLLHTGLSCQSQWHLQGGRHPWAVLLGDHSTAPGVVRLEVTKEPGPTPTVPGRG